MSEADLVSAAAYHRRMADLEQDQIKLMRPCKRRVDAERRRDLWLQLANEIDDYLTGQRALDDQEALL